ncbi:MAG: hypothetical protein FJ291_33040 [Planctomycetes bacterium]|nr:hypothetical protein [Planctomycetota bacterium]
MVRQALLLACGLAAAACAADARRPKKLIQTGWDQPDTERLMQNLAEMEKRPFDGVVVGAVGQIDEKRRCNLRTAFVNEKWQREWFNPCLAHLKACKPKRLTDNFLAIGANPGNVDWHDDAGWANVAEHWRIAAWLAKQGGLKGLLFDPEPYTPPHSQFGYAAQPEREKHTFDAYAAKARERGRQVMKAVAEEFPDIVLFSYFMNIVVSPATGHANPNRVLAAQGYGLLPAFIDGWLDAAPPAATFVDGCEMAYLYNSVEQYAESALLIKGACQELVSPENRAKYRAQVQVGFGIYLDAYWNPKEPRWMPWYIDGKGGSRVDRLRANLRTALRVADEYVWVYGEKFRWWPSPNKRVEPKAWPEALPGCEPALRLARDPLDYARSQLAELGAAGKLINLARNGDFASDKALSFEGTPIEWKEGHPPAGWHAWQAEKSKGAFTWDREAEATRVGFGDSGVHELRNPPARGAARAAGVTNGCFLQACAVKPGEHYAVGAARRLQGKGEAWLRVRWQAPEGAWTAEALDALIHCDAPRDAWGEMLGVVEVPEGAGRLLILLCVADQPAANDIAWFDDVRVHRLE